MKMNPDCIRDTLLCLEDNLTVNSSMSNMNYIRLSKLIDIMITQYNNTYNRDDIWYSVYLLHQAGYIEANIVNSGTYTMLKCEIKNITWEGHQFLNTIRPQPLWETIKAKALEIGGGLSMTAMGTAASTTIEEIVKNPNFYQDIINKLKLII